MNFKDRVSFYLGLAEEKEDDDKCPVCGKNPCECEDDGKEKGGKKKVKKVSKRAKDEDDDFNFDDEEDDEEANASASTKTAGGDDGDDGYHYSADTEEEDEEANASAITGKYKNDIPDDELTDEEIKLLKMVDKKRHDTTRTKGHLAGNLTPEEKKMLGVKKDKKEHAAVEVKDDHTNGRNGSVPTNPIKESLLSVSKILK